MYSNIIKCNVYHLTLKSILDFPSSDQSGHPREFIYYQHTALVMHCIEMGTKYTYIFYTMLHISKQNQYDEIPYLLYVYG